RGAVVLRVNLPQRLKPKTAEQTHVGRVATYTIVHGEHVFYTFPRSRVHPQHQVRGVARLYDIGHHAGRYALLAANSYAEPPNLDYLLSGLTKYPETRLLDIALAITVKKGEAGRGIKRHEFAEIPPSQNAGQRLQPIHGFRGLGHKLPDNLLNVLGCDSGTFLKFDPSVEGQGIS